MSVTLEQVNEQTWRVNGLMQINTIQALESQSKKMIDNAPNELIIDLGGVSRSDSTAVALMVSWLRLARQKKKSIQFKNLPDKMMDNIRVSGLDKVFTLMASEL